jgi:HSP20 family molecular chaperone IbpA
MTDFIQTDFQPLPPPPPPAPQPHPQGRGLLWLILALQVVILGWLAKNYYDGASARRESASSPAVPTVAVPPSLERAGDAPSPSPSPAAAADDDGGTLFAPPSPAAYRDPFALFRRAPARPFPDRGFPRWHADVQRMMDEAMEAHEAMLQDFGSFFSPGPEWAALPASPAVNMRELDDAYELTLSQPGLAPDDLDIRLDGRTLSLRYDRSSDSADARSRQSGSVRMRLPGPVADNTPPEILNENNRIRIRVAKPAPAPDPRKETP